MKYCQPSEKGHPQGDQDTGNYQLPAALADRIRDLRAVQASNGVTPISLGQDFGSSLESGSEIRY